jgi:GNAT superfamily N-acetyltransferase
MGSSSCETSRTRWNNREMKRRSVADTRGVAKSGELVVRRTTAEDWAALRAIRLEALSDTPDAYGSTYEGTVSFSTRRWKAMASEQRYFLAERDGVVLGMVSGGFNDQHPNTHWLYGMYVTPDARGSEVAPSLVNAVIAWATHDGASELYLHVTASVERARAFYRKMGFVETGDRFSMERNRILQLITMRRSLVSE